MFLVGEAENSLPAFAAGLSLSIVNSFGRHQGHDGMIVVVVVPVRESLAELSGVLY